MNSNKDGGGKNERGLTFMPQQPVICVQVLCLHCSPLLSELLLCANSHQKVLSHSTKKSLSVTKFTLRCVSLKSAPVHPNGGNHVSAAGMWVEGDQWQRIGFAVALLSLLSGRRWRQGWARCKSKGFQFNPEETGSDAISPGYK